MTKVRCFRCKREFSNSEPVFLDEKGARFFAAKVGDFICYECFNNWHLGPDEQALIPTGHA